jgi:hypothetical protein
MPQSFANALHDALADALAARTALTDLLGTPAFYSGAASPAGRDRLLKSTGETPNSYIVLGTSIEVPTGWFGLVGTVNDEMLNIWTDPHEGKKKALAIFAEMAEVLNFPIAIGSGLVLRGTANLIMIIPDDSGLYFGQVNYNAIIANA